MVPGVSVGTGVNLHDTSSSHTETSDNSADLPPATVVHSLPSLDEYLFGPEDTDQRSARLFEPVLLVEAHSETLEVIERPSALIRPHPVSAEDGIERFPVDDVAHPDVNRDALFNELAKRTSPRDLPIHQSTPLSDAPRFIPADLHSLLRPSPSRQPTPSPPADFAPARDLYYALQKDGGSSDPWIYRGTTDHGAALTPFGEVRLVSSEEGVERFPIEDVTHPHQSRSLGANELSVDMPNILPSPVTGSYRSEEILHQSRSKPSPDVSQGYRTPDDYPVNPDRSRSLGPADLSVGMLNILPSPVGYRTEGDAFPQRRYITEELITTTIEELLIVEGAPEVDSDRHAHLDHHANEYSHTPNDDGHARHHRQAPEYRHVDNDGYVHDASGHSLADNDSHAPLDDDQLHSGVHLIAASDGSFKVPLPARFETWLSMEPPADEDADEVAGASGASPHDLGVDAAEVNYYRISQEAAPSLESSGEFEGLDGATGATRLMNIQEILRLTDNCDRRTSFGLDVISEESEAERSARFEISRAPESSIDIDVEEHPRRASESASDVAARLLKSLSPSGASPTEIKDQDDSEDEVAEWGQTSSSPVVAEPFADDLAFEDDLVIENPTKKAFSIRDFVLTPEAGEVYDSDGLNPASYRAEREVEELDYEVERINEEAAEPLEEREVRIPHHQDEEKEPEWVIPSKSVEEIEEEEEVYDDQLDNDYETRQEVELVETRDTVENLDRMERSATRQVFPRSTSEGEPVLIHRKSLEYIEQTSRMIIAQALAKVVPPPHFDEAATVPEPVKNEKIIVPLHYEVDLIDRKKPESSLKQRTSLESFEQLEEDLSDKEKQTTLNASTVAEPVRGEEIPAHQEEMLEDVTREDEEPSTVAENLKGDEIIVPLLEEDQIEEDVTQEDDELPAPREDDIVEEEVLDARSSAQEVDVPAPESQASDVADTKTSDDDEGPTSTSSSPHDEDPETARDGLRLEDGVVKAVEDRSDAYYGIQNDDTASSSRTDAVQLVEAVDVLSSQGVVSDDGDVRLIRSRDALRVERRENKTEKETGAEVVKIRLENESMDRPSEAEREAPLLHPTVSRLGIDSKQPSLDRQSSVASDEMDRSSLMKLKLENNLDRAITSHPELEGELNTADVERFWEYRYNKSPRTMRELEAAKRRATEESEHSADKEIRRRTREEEDGAALDAEINRKLAEAEQRFLPRDSDRRESIDSERLKSALSSPRSSPSFLVDRLSQADEEGEEENEPGIQLSSSAHFFHLRSSSSSSASTASFNSMGDGRQGRVQREERNGGLTRDEERGGARVGGAYHRTNTASELERLYPYIRHSSYYLNYYRSANLSMEKQPASRNDYMLSRGLLRSSSSRDSLGMMRQSASTDFIRDVEASDRKSVTFRQRIEELVHTPPTLHRRLRSSTAQIRSILKSQHASNLLKIANENMLRELEQCVEERDRLSENIGATPADVSQLSPMTQSAQTRYRNHMVEQKERISVLIEDKYSLIKETLREDDMPTWLRGKEDSITITLVDHKRPHWRLFRRQSSSFFYQQQQLQQIESKRGSSRADLVTANDCARKLERLRGQFDRRDSEVQIEMSDNAGDLLSRICQRLSTSPNRMD